MNDRLTREQRIECIVKTLRSADPDSWALSIIYVTAEFDSYDTTLRAELAQVNKPLEDVVTEYELSINAVVRQREALKAELAQATADKKYHTDCINMLAKVVGRFGGTSGVVVNAAIQQLAEANKQIDYLHERWATEHLGG